MNTDALLNHVQGPLSAEGCALLYRYAQDVPDDGIILDLNCGHGRSSISLGLGLTEAKKDGTSIVSWDPHITDSADLNATKDGTLTAFIRNLRLFNVHHKVIPVIQSIRTVSNLLSKKSAHLVIAQIATNRVSFADSMVSVVEIAQHAVRKNGKIVLVCHNRADETVFNELGGSLFGEDFMLVDQTGLIRVYQYTGNSVDTSSGFEKASGGKAKKDS